MGADVVRPADRSLVPGGVRPGAWAFRSDAPPRPAGAARVASHLVDDAADGWAPRRDAHARGPPSRPLRRRARRAADVPGDAVAANESSPTHCRSPSTPRRSRPAGGAAVLLDDRG